MNAKLTVALVAYNEERHLAQAIESLLVQTYTDFILHIYDHGSQDATGSIADNFSRRDERIKVTHLAVNDPSTLFQKLIDGCETSLFMFAAGHDLYDPRYIECCVEPLFSSEKIVLAYSRAKFFGGYSGDEEIPGNFQTLGMPSWSRSLVTGYGLVYNYQFYGICRIAAYRQLTIPKSVVGADHVMMAGLALLGEFAEIPEVLLHMRQQEDYGDVEAYKKKHYSRDSQDAYVQFLRMMRAYICLADEHVESGINRDLMKLGYFTQTLIRNRDVLNMYGSSVKDFFAQEEMQDLKEKLGELIGIIEKKFQQFDIDRSLEI